MVYADYRGVAGALEAVGDYPRHPAGAAGEIDDALSGADLHHVHEVGVLLRVEAVYREVLETEVVGRHGYPPLRGSGYGGGCVYINIP